MAPGTMIHDTWALELEPVAIGETSWGRIYPIAGGRVSARGVDFAVDDSDDDGDPFDDDDDRDEDDEDEDDEREPAGRRGEREERGDWRSELIRREGEGDDRDDEDDRPRGRRRQRPEREEGADEPAEGEQQEWAPPNKAQWDRMTAALAKANREAGKRRLTARQLEKLGVGEDEDIAEWLLARGIDPDSGERITGDGGDSGADLFDDDQQDRPRTRTEPEMIAERRRIEQRGRARAEAQYRPAMVAFAADAAMREAGWSGNDLSLAMRLIDMHAVEVDFDDGVPVLHGLDEQVDQIKEEFPEWFRPRRASAPERAAPARTARPQRRGGARELDGGERPRGNGRRPTWLERADDQLMGRGGGGRR
jgi:hypothetical protein